MHIKQVLCTYVTLDNYNSSYLQMHTKQMLENGSQKGGSFNPQ